MTGKTAGAGPTLAERLQSGDSRWLARAITAVVDQAPEAEAFLRAVYPLSGRAAVAGLTGAPGSGKSTLVDALAAAYREQNETVGIVAVDPSSPFTGGAILGDRIRMQRHHADAGIFIRSLATRGALGGLAQAASDVIAILDAAGRRRILVETVGVGQDEVEVVRYADVTVVVLVPGMGDEVQAIKAGIMEIADVFVINKSDRGADRLEQEIQSSLASAASAGDWRIPIVRTVATTGQGVAELKDAIQARLDWLAAHGGLERHRTGQWELRLRQFLRDRLAERMLGAALTPERLHRMAAEIAEHRGDPYSVADRVIAEAMGAVH